ncbi:MAG: hypothetical protein GEU73_05775 [Chloroflexi bacterium]|nr:hypothetical protein [Chloroflexota bacterium]
MNPNVVAIDLVALDLRVLLWPALFALGAYLLLSATPIGRHKPELAERLRRLDVDERMREEVGRGEARPIFASRLLEGILRPVLDDLGRLLRSALGRLGLAGGVDLEHRLQVGRPGVEPAQFFGEKVAVALVGLTVFPVMNVLGIHPFGNWPFWLWAVGFAVGFLAPNWHLERRLASRRTRVMMELPTLLDMLTIATSAGLSLEQAFSDVARQAQGLVAQDLQRAVREMAVGQRSVADALEMLAERNGVPELKRLSGHLRAAHEQGVPLVQALTTQAEALRDQKRLRIVEEGNKATVRMILPVALFILPVLFVVLLVPAAVTLMRLGG